MSGGQPTKIGRTEAEGPQWNELFLNYYIDNEDVVVVSHETFTNVSIHVRVMMCVRHAVIFLKIILRNPS